MKIKEAPGFFLIGLILSAVLLFVNIALFLRDAFSINGWRSPYLGSSLVFLWIVIYFAYKMQKCTENTDDKDRCG